MAITRTVELGDGVIPVIGDANSLNYVLHLKLGEELVLTTHDRTSPPSDCRLLSPIAFFKASW